MTRFIAGANVPLIQDATTGAFSGYVNFGSPHVHVVTENNNAYFLQSSTNVRINIDKILFSSYWFEYLEIIQEAVASVTFLQRDPNLIVVPSGSKKDSATSYYQAYYGTTSTTLVAHNLGYEPIFTCFDDGFFLNSTYFYQTGTSFRVFQVVATSTEIQVKENYLVWQDTLPAITKSFNVQIMKGGINGESGYTQSNYGLYTDDSRVIFGQGKFDSQRNYLYISSSGKPFIKNNGMWNELDLVSANGYNQPRNTFGMDIDGVNYYKISNWPSNPPRITGGLLISRDDILHGGETIKLSKP